MITLSQQEIEQMSLNAQCAAIQYPEDSSQYDRELIKAAWNSALEKAAEIAYECLDDPYLSGHGYATNIADAIRALKEE